MNSWHLSFSNRLNYGPSENIVIPLAVSLNGSNRILMRAKLDSGSTFCIFQRLYADLLGLETERGVAERIGTATGAFTAYGHEITLTVMELEWRATVYFAEPEDFPVSVVGRVGFLDRLKVGLVIMNSRFISALTMRDEPGN